MQITGNYHDGKTTASLQAQLAVVPDQPGTVRVSFLSTTNPLSSSLDLLFSDLKIASRLGNIPREISFGDGQLFVTDDNDAVDDLIRRYSGSASRLHRLETNIPLILFSVVFTIMLVWAGVVYGIPASAKAIAFNLPGFTSEKLGSSLSVLDRTVFEVSALPASRQKEIRELIAPYLGYYQQLDPKLVFRSGMQANALALPSGEIVLTDDFVNLVKNDQELLAVFFHEMGHLQHRHIVRRALQGTMLSLMIVFITGDVDSFDLITGLPTLILDLSYSREFEREADVFALEQLARFGISPRHFAAVMARLEDYYTEQSKKSERADQQTLQSDGLSAKRSVSDFFSSHPATEDRIELILQYQKNRSENGLKGQTK
ncbi:MAG: M48 family metallopeptidase [Gammaproteobacteria bacterium]|nr:M48 family metallopeptidase [Gammaproteobacteria bacterium]